MFGFDDPEAFWLNVTNVALGIVVLICLGAVGYAVVGEVLDRIRKRALVAADDHATLVPGLGVTMADGGERIDNPSGTYVAPNGDIVRNQKKAPKKSSERAFG
ncbi:MAG: hypothetical protein FJ215_00915 [Ignavibacteria bacterium]|nr:hypothetical protein [Ignavibacteria bacterium]